jgi:hypothetical protein
VLVVERGVNPEERLRQQKIYSQPMADGRPALVLRLHQDVSIYSLYSFPSKQEVIAGLKVVKILEKQINFLINIYINEWQL